MEGELHASAPAQAQALGQRRGGQARVTRGGAHDGVQQVVVERGREVAHASAAQQAGTSGLVRLGVIITKDGRVRDITVMSSPGMQLGIAAMQAVKEWVYQPTLLNGAPVEVATTVDINFAAGGK